MIFISKGLKPESCIFSHAGLFGGHLHGVIFNMLINFI